MKILISALIVLTLLLGNTMLVSAQTSVASAHNQATLNCANSGGRLYSMSMTIYSDGTVSLYDWACQRRTRRALSLAAAEDAVSICLEEGGSDIVVYRGGYTCNY